MIRLFEEEECINEISKSGVFISPLFGNLSRISPGESYDLQVFARSDYQVQNVNFIFEERYRNWFRMALNHDELETTQPGKALHLEALSSTPISFWIRVTVPEETGWGEIQTSLLAFYDEVSQS